MTDQIIWRGVQSLLDRYVHISDRDTVLILFTSDSAEAVALICAALETRRIEYERCWMAPLQDAEFGDRLACHMPDRIGPGRRLVVLTFERDTMSHTTILAQKLERFDPGQVLLCRSISTGPDFFRTALQADPEHLSAINSTLLHHCTGAERLKIITDGGTNLTVEIDSDKYRWISNRGMARAGGAMILPAGEVATYPAAISGVHVADFAFNVNAICDRDARLEATPVTVWIDDGRARDYHCDNPEMKRFLDQCFNTHCAYAVGELGFGTNIEVTAPIALNSHVNERRPGVHLGFGQHNQDIVKMGYQCQIHLDLIARGGMVYIDDNPVPIDLEAIAPSSLPHPEQHEDEDVFSPARYDLEVDDCCGTVGSNGLVLCAL